MSNCGCNGAGAPGKALPRRPRPQDIGQVAVVLAAAWAIVKGEWGALLLLAGAVVAYRHITAPAATSSAPSVAWQSDPPDSTGLYGANVSGVGSQTTTVLGISSTITPDC